MPRGGVKELLKSSDGRRYLSRLQEKYGDDILQPTDRHTGKANERFIKIYGERIKRSNAIREKQTREAKDAWKENEDRKRYRAGKRSFF